MSNFARYGWLVVAVFGFAFACSSSLEGDGEDESSEGALERKDAGDAGDAGDARDADAQSNEAGGVETLLRCNVFEGGGGPDQEVIVKRQGNALTLVELTNHGSTEERALDVSEWESRVIQLRKELYDDVNTLTKEGRSWRNESKSGGWRTVGYADCSIDKTN